MAHQAKRYHSLTSQEEQIIEHAGTELPGSGELTHCHQEGVYLCRKCDAPLYLSGNKFDSGCGWPSFDEEVPGAVDKLRDPDGRRTEIRCHHCHAHLGHVFYGEGFTDKSCRHCVNSTSMRFISAYTQEGYEKALFAGGCFWGVEYWFSSLPGVVRVTSGYCGGTVANPIYEEVCSGTTGHAETVLVEFDPAKVTFEQLARLFFEIHDPCQLDGQGPDHGHQYRSVVFCLTEQQKQVAEQLKQQLIDLGFPVVTEIAVASLFYPAEAYHQHYYQQQQQPYCHRPVARFPEES